MRIEDPTVSNKLVLGTVQLGMPYGIANTSGQPDLKTTNSIIKAAWEGGIREFDTAQAYGKSEKALGNAIKHLDLYRSVKILSKFSPQLDYNSFYNLRQALEQSLKYLCVPKLYGIMLHRDELLDYWHQGLSDILLRIVKTGLVQNIGVSVNSPRKALQAIESDGISFIQIPSNILDRRFENAGVFNKAEICSKTIYIRSIFLQGLLLLRPEDLPENMQYAYDVLNTFQMMAEKNGISKLQLAVGYIREAYPSAKIIFGAETPQQVAQTMESWHIPTSKEIINRARNKFRDIDECILNPSLWPFRS